MVGQTDEGKASALACALLAHLRHLDKIYIDKQTEYKDSLGQQSV